MKPPKDVRRLRLQRVKMVDGEMRIESGADIWEDPATGRLQTSGIWSGLVPLATEDIEIQARRQSISPLEWLRLRFLSCSGVLVEVIE